MNEIKFLCLHTFAADKKEYGIDFYKGKMYSGRVEDKEHWYVNSTENGTSVLMSNEEMEKYFKQL